MTGSIIANQGFIKTYGTAHDSTGKQILDANVLASWGGIQSMGQGLGMLSMHLSVRSSVPLTNTLTA
jgi:hypothetical protein